MNDLIYGILIGGGVFTAGSWLGYEIGRSARLAQPLIRSPFKRKEEQVESKYRL